MSKRYKFPNLGSYQLLAQELIKGGQSVVIYGFNEAGKRAYNILKEKKIRVVAILDLYQSEVLQEHEGINVYSPDDFQDYRDDFIYLVCSNRYFDEMRNILIGKGCKNILPHYAVYCDREFTYDEYINVYQIAQRANDNRKIEEKHLQDACIIDTLDVVITEKCSLKCKNCSNLMQYFVNPQNESLCDVTKIFEALLNTVDYIHEIRILGGEPFANVEWHKYVEALLKYDNFGCILVYSNGTILPKEEQLQVFSDERVFLTISDYGEISRKKHEVVETMRASEYFYSIAKVSEWIDCGRIVYRVRTEDELRHMYHECCMSGCLSLKGGKIFACPFAGNLHALGAISDKESDYVDIALSTEQGELKEKIAWIQRKEYIAACQYCPGRPIGVKNIPAAEQCNKPLPYERKN